MAFSFHAGFVHCDGPSVRLTFANRNDEEGKHYFVMDRSEDPTEEALPDMKNVYIERDDQQLGGYGGIESVVLERDSLTVQLGPRMATLLGQYDRVIVTFDLKHSEFSELRNVVRLIMRGYESRLECHA